MNRELLLEIDSYVERLFVPTDPVLAATLQSSERHGLPPIHVSPTEGRLLYILTRIISPKRVLEVGTLAGYSTIWIGRALEQQSRIVTIELNPETARIAKENLTRAGLGARAEVRVGDARSVLDEMCSSGEEPFDLIFIDADKESYVDYLTLSLRLSRPGTVILTDNLLRNGGVIAPSPDKPHHQALARANAELAGNARLDSTVVAIINRYTVDGLGISIVGEPPNPMATTTAQTQG